MTNNQGKSIQEQIQYIKKQLVEKGYKLTQQREVTVRVLLEHEKDHFSAEEVFLLVKEQFPEIGLATVYRTLELLSDLQVVEKINFGDGAARFDLRSTDGSHHHHHLICMHCGSVEEIMEDGLLKLEQMVERQYGFKVMDHRLDFQGVCRECRQKQAVNEPAVG
ncbi:MULTISPECIES: ferric iron uptake transcriptional regulator [Paenibacillus]|uniref:ferric iron uptake transcriptional regulator n=1 Tax=Paenibacillus TaxID=44249 RepID=UPI001F9AF8B0|nr:Fur family transcriptional regulator [Paenibacillus sp. JJ-223]CAH1190901.1 Ferric uptake regulation protein [Paenibacillus sp. JJ-223]